MQKRDKVLKLPDGLCDEFMTNKSVHFGKSWLVFVKRRMLETSSTGHKCRNQMQVISGMQLSVRM